MCCCLLRVPTVRSFPVKCIAADETCCRRDERTDCLGKPPGGKADGKMKPQVPAPDTGTRRSCVGRGARDRCYIPRGRGAWGFSWQAWVSCEAFPPARPRLAAAAGGAGFPRWVCKGKVDRCTYTADVYHRNVSITLLFPQLLLDLITRQAFWVCWLPGARARPAGGAGRAPSVRGAPAPRVALASRLERGEGAASSPGAPGRTGPAVRSRRAGLRC